MIRPATLADVPRVLELGAANHAAARSGAPYDPVAAEATVRGLIESDDAVILLSDGGMIGGLIVPFWASPSDREAWELCWYATDGSGLRLLRAFQAWASERGARVRVTCRGGEAAMARVGLHPIETIYGES